MRVYLNEIHRMVKNNPALRWRIIKTVSCFLRGECLANAELGVILSGDRHLAYLNRQYRNIKEPTDVLSFPFYEHGELTEARKQKKRFFLGEVYISVDRALAQAEEESVLWEKRVIYLLAHGLYHLAGYDHATEEDKVIMDSMVDELIALST